MDTPARHLQTCLASIKGLVIVVVGVCGCELKSYSQCVNKQPWVIIKARHWKAWNYGYVCRVIVTVVPKHRKGTQQTQDWVSQGRRWPPFGRWPKWWLNSRPHNRSRRWCHRWCHAGRKAGPGWASYREAGSWDTVLADTAASPTGVPQRCGGGGGPDCSGYININRIYS